jgi:nitrous oxidase accessory protein NosD
MKPILTILSALFLLLVSVSTAHAVTCAKGVYRAGCTGANGGAVVTNRPATVPPRGGAVVVAPPRGGAVVVPAPQCAWVNGRKVCR